MSNGRNLTQRRPIPLLFRSVGYLLLILSAIMILGAILSIPMLLSSGSITLPMFTATIVVPLLLAIGILWMGTYLVAHFPKIRIFEDGFEFGTGLGSPHIRWDSVDGIVDTRGPFRAIGVRLNAEDLFINRFQALLWTGNGSLPIVLIDPLAEGADEFLSRVDSSSISRP